MPSRDAKSVEVIIPVHGDLPFLHTTLRSLAAQTRPIDLLTFVNDRVDDLAAVEGIANSLFGNKYRVLRADGPGISAALNTALDACLGDYLIRIDADDVAHPERVERQVACLAESKIVGFCGSNLRFIDEHDRPIGRSQYPLSFNEVENRLFRATCFCHPAVCFDAQTLRTIRYRSELNGAEDLDLFLRLVDVGCRPINLPEPLLDYRMHSRQVSFSARARQTVVQELAWRAARVRKSGGPDPLEVDPELAKRFISWRLSLEGFADARQGLTAVRYAGTYLGAANLSGAIRSASVAFRCLGTNPHALKWGLKMLRQGIPSLQFEKTPFPELNA